MTHILKNLTRLSLCLFFMTGASATSVLADDWVQYKDEDGVFHVLIPENYKINTKSLRITEKMLATNTDLTAIIDERPYKDSVRQYAVKYTQTLAERIAPEDIPNLLAKEVQKYIDYYNPQGGVLLDKNFSNFGGRPGAEIILAYKNPEGKLESIRARILFSDVTKLEQIMVGPEDSLKTYRTNDFFSSLRLKEGRTAFKGSFEEDWEKVTSPFKLFTVTVPRKTEPFVPENPKTLYNDRTERLSMKFVDPVYDNLIFYNVYGYRFNTLMTKANVQEVVLEKHLKKFKVDIRQTRFVPTSNGNVPILSSKTHFPAPKKYPYMNTIVINAYYYGNFLVVQEMVGNNAHLESNIAQKIRSYITFTPIDANQKLIEDKASKSYDDSKSDNFGEETEENMKEQSIDEAVQNQTSQNKSDAPAILTPAAKQFKTPMKQALPIR